MEASVPKIVASTGLLLEEGSSSMSVTKSPKSVADGEVALHKIKGKIQKKGQSKPTLKDQQTNRMVFQEGGLPDGCLLTYVYKGQTRLTGNKQGHKIYCHCCKKLVTPSMFEAHAGSVLRKKPYSNIFTSDGISLQEHASALKLNFKPLVKKNDDICKVCHKGQNLLACDGCPRSYHEGCIDEAIIPTGNKWFCRFCIKAMKAPKINANAIAAGRKLGVNRVEQNEMGSLSIFKNPNRAPNAITAWRNLGINHLEQKEMGSISIFENPDNPNLDANAIASGRNLGVNLVENPDNPNLNVNAIAAGRNLGVNLVENPDNPNLNASAIAAGRNLGVNLVENPDSPNLIACVVCRSYDFSEDGFNDQTVIVCDQCEREFHIGCLRESLHIDLTALPEGIWLCSDSCVRVYEFIMRMLKCAPLNIPDNLLRSFSKKLEDGDATNVEMEWILVRGKNAPRSRRSFLKEVVDIIHENFEPVIDTVTGSDFVPSMVYGLKMGSLDFSGTICGMLVINSKVVTAGVFRVFGDQFAELPFIATEKSHQGKGYFRIFIYCLRKMLSHLKVQRIVLPAAASAEDLWTKQMGFCKPSPEQLYDYQETWTSMVSFDGTTLLHRNV